MSQQTQDLVVDLISNKAAAQMVDLIVATLRFERPSFLSTPEYDKWYEIVVQFGSRLSKVYPKFNCDKFLSSCGVE